MPAVSNRRTIVVRVMQPADHADWARMRAALWPEADAAGHLAEISAPPKNADAWAFLAVNGDGKPAGFAEVSIRTCANGCDSQPVPFLEGIWVEMPFRRRGVGAMLVRHIETFLKDRGFHEWGSDALIENEASHAAHRGWGFAEVERVVCYRRTF
jgi:aminoglycoside 6'-N-acetyltransferase I